MKKLLLSAAFLAACASLSAQKFTYVPWTDNGYLTGSAISSDGRYVAGNDLAGQAFIYDTQVGQIKYFASPDLDEDTQDTQDADVRSIGCDGIGVGYLASQACQFNFATGEYTPLRDESSIANWRSEDGTSTAGFTYTSAYEWTPYYEKDGEVFELPQPTEEWLGYKNMGLSVTGGAADGSILCGAAQDNFATKPLCFWVRNLDGKTYSLIPASKRFYDASIDLDGPQEYDCFGDAAISANGKWICLNVHRKVDEDGGMTIARYDVLNDTVEYINCPDVSPIEWYYANSISNDGTIVGYIEDQVNYGRVGMICKAGETEAKRIAEVYADVAELAQLDANQLNTPCAITPDGRYIVGFGYVDYDDESLCYGTWYFDTKGGEDAVERVAAADGAAQVVASYDVDGKAKHISGTNRGLRINKLANGKVRKVVK